MKEEAVKKVRVTRKNYIEIHLKNGEFYLIRDDLKRRVFMMQPETFLSILKGYEKTFGSGYAVIVRVGAENAGRESAYLATKNMSLEEKLKYVKAVFSGCSSWGFGVYELAKFEPEKPHIVLRIYNSVFASSVKGKNEAESFADHYLTGFLQGFFSEIFGKKLKCYEVCCIAKDKTDYCEFELSPAEEG
ncbi:MAG: 4-vinyl reductase [Candidatus Bathyarchaeota archaeon]|nr:4-vinyl reductase [Candidatus Bathyarchaeota archaeon]